MITSKIITPINALKKEQYYGSYKGMQFSLYKSEDELIAVTYPQPFCFSITSEKLKTVKHFPFNDEGRTMAIDWFNEQYISRKKEWDEAASSPWV